MKKLKSILLIFMITVLVWGAQTLQIMAQEDSAVEVSELNQIMTVQADCDAREFPDKDAPAAHHYSAGESVWVTGETQDGWYRISYQGQEWYILKESTMDLQIETQEQGTVDLVEAGLDEEMAEVEVEGKILVEEVERQREEQNRSRIWVVIIILLIAGVFATGIISVTKKDKKAPGKDSRKVDKKRDVRPAAGAKTNEFDIVDLDEADDSDQIDRD